MADDNGWLKVEMGDTWKPEKEGDEVIGLYLGKEENVGENGSNLYSLESQDHQNISVWGSTVLDIRMKNVKVGEEVKIVFKGLKDSPNRKGKQYKDFEVYHREPVFSEV